MSDNKDILIEVRTAAQKNILFLPHALRQMMRPDRMISPTDVRKVIASGEVIEDYPEDPRGHSCLLLGFGNDGCALHVCCAPKDDYLRSSQRTSLMIMSGQGILERG